MSIRGSGRGSLSRFRGAVAVVALVASGWGLLYLLGLLMSGRKTKGRLTGRPVNFAHRGDSSRAPENTMEAFALAVESGAGGLEMDAHLTADGEVVVIHDDSVDRTTDGSGPVVLMTLEELSARDAGYRFTENGEDFPYRDRGVQVRTLREVYETFPGAWVNVEVKSADPEAARRVLDVIKRAGAEKRTVVASAGRAGIRRFRAASGGSVATSASVAEILAFYVASLVGLHRLLPVRYVALQVPARTRWCEVVTPRFVAAAKSRGVGVDVWTINDAAEMRRLLDLGVDVIMTDRPGELGSVLRGRADG